ncbi:MAG: polysaccharide biosynthesis/export family protein [Nitrospirae bacterium]|nr:polysaccharide biosynthesis/export family protein [Nitrospirota bacterium]
MFSIFSCGGSNTVKADPGKGYTAGVPAANIKDSKNEAEAKSANIATTAGTSSKHEQLNELLMKQPANTLRESDYILGPEDLIEIDVFQVEELKRTVRINSSGFINLPIIGRIDAGGLTISELEAEINKSLTKYLQEPAVTVFIREYRSQRITVIGAVRNPQVFTITNQKSLLDMLSASGGLTENAGDICYVRRGNQTMVVDLKELLQRGNAELNVLLLNGDVVHVPPGGIIFVDGAVNSPGSFVMQGTVTLTQAISMAKGFQYEADRGQLRIYRDTGKEDREGIDVDYDAILKRETQDIVLKDKDIVIVSKNGVKNFLKGFVDTIRGFISFGRAL